MYTGYQVFFRDVKNIPLEGTVSQIFFLGLSRFHKTKTRTFKKDLRHCSLHLDLNSLSVLKF